MREGNFLIFRPAGLVPSRGLIIRMLPKFGERKFNKQNNIRNANDGNGAIAYHPSEGRKKGE